MLKKTKIVRSEDVSFRKDKQTTSSDERVGQLEASPAPTSPPYSEGGMTLPDSGSLARHRHEPGLFVFSRVMVEVLTGTKIESHVVSGDLRFAGVASPFHRFRRDGN